MKRLWFAILALAAPLGLAQMFPGPGGNVTASGGGGANGYSRSITVDHTKVPNTDQTDFAVLISGTYTYLKSEGNGGKVHNASGYDIIFCTSSACTTKITTCEVEYWNPATGEIVAWVKRTLTTASDTVFYIGYGNTGISSNQCTPSTTWDSSSKLVAHFGNGTTLSAADSTGVNDGSITDATAVDGKVKGGADFNGTTAVINFGADSSISAQNPITMSCWIKRPAAGPNYLLWKRDGSGGIYLAIDGDTSKVSLGIPGVGLLLSTGTVSTGSWHHVAVTASSGGVATFYIDGAASGTGTGATVVSAGANLFSGARSDTDGNVDGYSAQSLDECRLNSAERSADWIATGYNNQSSPSTFLAIGSETTL